MKIESIGKIAIVALLAVALLAVPACALDIDTTVDLEEGTFTFHPSNNPSASYTVDCMTVMGALEQAQDDNLLTYNATEYWYTNYGPLFSLVDINGVCNDHTNHKAWFLYIDADYLSYGLGLNAIEEEECAQFKYCEYNTTTWEPVGNPIHSVDLTVV